MSLSTQVYVWPTSSSTLREILGLDSSPSVCCHGTTKKHNRCKMQVAKGSSVVVSDLLSQIVRKNSFEAAKSLLNKVSQLVLCKTYHQEQSLSWLDSWEKKLSLYKPPVVEVKKEEELEDAKSMLAGLQDKSIKSEKISLSTPIKPFKTKADSSKKPVKKEKKIPSVDSYPTETTPKRSLARSPTQHVFQPYSEPLSTTALNQSIQDLILRPLLLTEKKSNGKIYLFTFPSNYHDRAPYFKIGHAEDVTSRMTRWEKQCGYKPKVIAEFAAENHAKVERLVHIQLQNKRLREAGGCPTCGVKHHEWFNVRSQNASSIIGLWTAWTRQEPYDENGCLKKKWVKRVNGVDLSDSNCWEEFVSGEHEDEGEDESDDTYYSADDDTYSSTMEETDDEDW